MSIHGVIRWGILGTGKIAHRFAASLAQAEGCELVALSGRRGAKLEAFACAHGIPRARRYADDDGSTSSAYERLAEDPDIDAVYLALPHGMHAEWACRLLRAGKAVLCEKPAAVSAGEARLIARTARETGSLFMEAMKTRFAPARRRAIEIARGGELGSVTGLTCVHRIDYGLAASAYLLDPVAGGCLLDLGCYDVDWACELLPGAVRVDSVDVVWRAAEVPEERETPMGTEASAPSRSAYVDWADDVRLTAGGVPVQLDLSGGAETYQAYARISLEHGEIEIPLLHRPVSMVIRRAGQPEEHLDLPFEVDDFFGEIVHFNELLRAGALESPIMPLAATVRDAEVIDAIKAAWPRV